MGVLFNSVMYTEGEEILGMANESIQNIQDASVKAAVQDNLDNAFAAAQNNIDINADLFQYSWLLMIGLAGLVVFMFTRRLVETNQGGIV